MSLRERFRPLHRFSNPEQRILLQPISESKRGRRMGLVPRELITYTSTPQEPREESQQYIRQRSGRERRTEAKNIARFKQAVAEFSKPQPELPDIRGDKTKISHHLERFFNELKRGDKIHREIGATVVSGALIWAPFIGGAIITIVNGVNTGLEIRDIFRGKGNIGRAAWYALLTAWEASLVIAPQFILAKIGAAGFFRFAGQYVGNVVGAFLGTFTNTTLQELRRERKKEEKESDAIAYVRRVSKEQARTIITDRQQLRRNLNKYLYGKEENSNENDISQTNLGHLRVLRDSLESPTDHRLKRWVKKPIKGYYEREIALEEIKRSTAQGLLHLLDDLENN